MAVPTATLTVGTNPADPTGKTVRFTVSGSPGPITWRFGDLRDHPDTDPTGIDHTYSRAGTYHVIGHIGATGQRMTADVEVVESGDGGGGGMTITGITPTSGAGLSTASLLGSGVDAVDRVTYDGTDALSVSAGAGFVTTVVPAGAPGDLEVIAYSPTESAVCPVPFTRTAAAEE